MGFTARAGMTIRASTGLEALGESDRMSTIFFYKARPGDRLTLLDSRYLYNVATYAPEVDTQYIYTYSYQPNESWTRYNCDLSGETYRTKDYIFTSDCYFRLCFKRLDGGDFTDAEAETVNEIIRFVSVWPEAERTVPEFINTEAERVAGEISAVQGENSLVFALMSDSHYTVNGTWEDTLDSLRAVNKRMPFDGVIHLGDMTDGMVTANVTREYVRNIKKGLLMLGCPLYIAIGNHDSNYFGRNSEPFTLEEQRELYLGHISEADKAWYLADYQGLRLLFLHSFDYTEQYRYGYSDECLDWLEAVLSETAEDVSVIVFSHLTLLTHLQVWTDHIRGTERLIRLLQGFKQGGGKLLAYINGHNHADQVDKSLGFPVISIGCAKTEYFEEHKPEGSVRPKRKLGDVTQELWDALVVSPDEGIVSFARFGAHNPDFKLTLGGKHE